MKRALLAMSGGIDSAVSAVLLQEQGFEVIGASMLLHDPKSAHGISGGCFGSGSTTQQAVLDKVASLLGIEVVRVDLSQEFEREVLDHYRRSYLRGLTPNPCVVCNQSMKFGLLPQALKSKGVDFDFYATGHYARIRFSAESGRWQLLKGIDPLKDQSYFLCQLKQEQLATTIFPLGDLSKAQVRQIARERGLDFLLHTAESQDFLSEEDHPRLFDQKRIEPGDMVDPDGKVIGRHRGLIYYTIGQRRHLGISGKSEPWYVTSIDATRNQVVTGPRSYLYRDRLIAENVNWVSIPPPSSETRVETKIRLAHTTAPGILKPQPDKAVQLVFETPQLSIAPGQFAVFYHGETLLGGGTIA